jgi:hypothetical protein
VLEIVVVVLDGDVVALVELVKLQYILMEQLLVDDNILVLQELKDNKIVVVELENNIVVLYLDQQVLEAGGIDGDDDKLVVVGVAFVVVDVDLITLDVPLLVMTLLPWLVEMNYHFLVGMKHMDIVMVEYLMMNQWTWHNAFQNLGSRLIAFLLIQMQIDDFDRHH